VRNIVNFPSNRFGGFPPFYSLEFLHAKYEILPIPRAGNVPVPREGKKQRLFLDKGVGRGLLSWPSDVMAYLLTHTFGKRGRKDVKEDRK